MTGLDELTGLPEYRNGGLLLDLGVLVPHDADFLRRTHAVGDEAVVEWRALTVIALDRIAAAVREVLGVSAQAFPLARVLEGGTWAAGRRIAAERREGGTPPVSDRQRRHRLLISLHRNNRGYPMPDMLTVVDHPLILHKLTHMRRKDTSTEMFRRLLGEIAQCCSPTR